MQEIIFKKTSDLKPHALNAAIYGDGADSDLLESIKKHGILTPILVTESSLVISGHRRLNAAQMVGLETVPVTIVDAVDQLEEEELLIMTNRQRQKTNEQKMREGKKLLEIEQERARRRMLAGKKIECDPTQKSGEGHPMQKSAEGIPATGESRKVVAEKVGVSHDTLTKGIAVVETIDELKAAGQDEKANELRETLNKKSVNAASKKVKGETHCPKCKRKFDSYSTERGNYCARCDNDPDKPEEIVKCIDCLKNFPKSMIIREICDECLQARQQLWACVFGAPIPDYPAEITQCYRCRQMVIKDSAVIEVVNGVQRILCSKCIVGVNKEISCCTTDIAIIDQEVSRQVHLLDYDKITDNELTLKSIIKQLLTIIYKWEHGDNVDPSLRIFIVE